MRQIGTDKDGNHFIRKGKPSPTQSQGNERVEEFIAKWWKGWQSDDVNKMVEQRERFVKDLYAMLSKKHGMPSPITGISMVQEAVYDYEDPDNKGDSKAARIHWKDVDNNESFTDETQEEINLYALKTTRELQALQSSNEKLVEALKEIRDRTSGKAAQVIADQALSSIPDNKPGE